MQEGEALFEGNQKTTTDNKLIDTMNIPLFSNPFEAASKAASRAALKHLFDAMLWRSWKRPAPKGKGFTPIQFRNPDGCRLSGWVYRAPGKKFFGVAHPGLPGGDIWNSPIYRRFLHEFYQRIFTR